MAGTESDLLKQATQAMMSRYAGKNTCWSLRRGAMELRYTHKCFFFGAVLAAGGSTKFCTDAPSKDCARGFHPHPVSAFSMMSLAHASTSKLTRGLINAAIGNLGAPKKGQATVHGVFAI
jgi:hypothetical protein